MRSPIRLLPAKRANRAMLTSTMRLAFETTIERRRNRASQCRWRALSRSTAWCTDRLAGAEELSGVGERPLFCPWIPIVPFKRNQDCRHHIPRQQRKVTNWPAYDASLRQRGSLTVWFTDEAVE